MCILRTATHRSLPQYSTLLQHSWQKSIWHWCACQGECPQQCGSACACKMKNSLKLESIGDKLPLADFQHAFPQRVSPNPPCCWVISPGGDGFFNKWLSTLSISDPSFLLWFCLLASFPFGWSASFVGFDTAVGSVVKTDLSLLDQMESTNSRYESSTRSLDYDFLQSCNHFWTLVSTV